jgi:hypothetical protein
MAEISDHGQNLRLSTRRGADLRFALELTDADDAPIDLTGAELLSRISAPNQPTKEFEYSVGGNTFTVTLSAAVTRNMGENWSYTLGFKLGGVTQALLYGQLYVAQEAL